MFAHEVNFGLKMYASGTVNLAEEQVIIQTGRGPKVLPVEDVCKAALDLIARGDHLGDEIVRLKQQNDRQARAIEKLTLMTSRVIAMRTTLKAGGDIEPLLNDLVDNIIGVMWS